MNATPKKENGLESMVSQVCEQTGFSADMLRFREKACLTTALPRRNGRRADAGNHVQALQRIDCLNKPGMPLAEIAEFVYP